MSWSASPSTRIYLYIYTCFFFVRCVLDSEIGASCVIDVRADCYFGSSLFYSLAQGPFWLSNKSTHL